MAQFKLNGGVRHNGRQYRAGEMIDLDETQAASFRKSGLIGGEDRSASLTGNEGPRETNVSNAAPSGNVEDKGQVSQTELNEPAPNSGESAPETGEDEGSNGDSDLPSGDSL